MPIMIIEQVLYCPRLFGTCPSPASAWQEIPIGLTMAMTGAALFGVVSPMVHGVHGDTNKWLIDMGLRVGAPLALGALAYVVGEAAAGGSVLQNGCSAIPPGLCWSPQGVMSGAAGVVAGMGIAAVVDHVICRGRWFQTLRLPFRPSRAGRRRSR
jgi:hypothetical protein